MYSHPPLSRRVVKDRSRGVCVTSEEMSREMFSLRGKYKGWDSGSMHKAIKEEELGMSIRRAAEIYPFRNHPSTIELMVRCTVEQNLDLTPI